MKIDFEDAHFIKLGESGKWAQECIDSGFAKLGFFNPLHKACLEHKWTQVRSYWIKVENKTEAKATDITNQIQSFYEAPENHIWITFHDRKLYWCFLKEGVSRLEKGYRTRNTLSGWSCKDVNQSPLTIDQLSSTLTKTQAYRGTICSVEAKSYLKLKINGSTLPAVKAASNKYDDLCASIADLVRSLTWQDFELLTDLIFTFSGWKRIETLGKTQKSIDLDMVSPLDRRRAYIQVKSKADLSTFMEYYEDFKNMSQYTDMFFVVHTPSRDLNSYTGKGSDQILKVETISKLAVDSGLTDWIIRKTK